MTDLREKVRSLIFDAQAVAAYDRCDDADANAELEKATDAITAEVQAEREWRPISEAPRDGTPVLLFARAKTATACIPVIGWWINDMGWIEACFTPNKPVGLVPSHFMPLPAPPQDSASD